MVTAMATEGAVPGAIPGRASGSNGDPEPDRDSDAVLMQAVIGGSQDALARLYDRHSRAVFGAALRMSRDQSIAAERVQETFLCLWNRAELYEPGRGWLPSWLLTISRNRAVDDRSASGPQHSA